MMIIMIVGLLLIMPSLLRVRKMAGSNQNPETDCLVIFRDLLQFLKEIAGILPQGGYNSIFAHHSQSCYI